MDYKIALCVFNCDNSDFKTELNGPTSEPGLVTPLDSWSGDGVPHNTPPRPTTHSFTHSPMPTLTGKDPTSPTSTFVNGCLFNRCSRCKQPAKFIGFIEQK